MSSNNNNSNGGYRRGGRGRGRGNGGSPPIDRATVSRGICQFYWSTGIVNATSTPTDHAPDFFSLEGLATNNGSIVDPRYTLRPSEAHNHLKPYLCDNFVFRNAIHVEGFSRILASVNSRNRTWAFLDFIVRGNALLRIGEVLRFSPVAVNVGAETSTLSYQKGYFPILEFLSSDLVLKTTMHQNTKWQDIYSHRSELQQFSDDDPHMHDFNDRCSNLGELAPQTLSTVLSQYFARFKHAMQNHPELRDFVDDLFPWFFRWATAIKVSPPTFDDSITSSRREIRDLTLAEREKDINRLRLITNREYRHTERMRRAVAHTTVTAGQIQQALTSRITQTYDPPGTLRDGGEPRHDNDFADIRDIRIVPTHKELLCPIPPDLPVFLPIAPHHVQRIRCNAISISSFDFLFCYSLTLMPFCPSSSIRLSIGEIRKDLQIMQAPGAKSKPRATLLETLLGSKGGAYKTSGSNSVFFYLYTGARFAPAKAERRHFTSSLSSSLPILAPALPWENPDLVVVAVQGAPFTVGLLLDAPPGGAHDKSGKRRALFWEHSRRLQSGSLVALILISPDRFQVFLGTTISTGSDIGESAKSDAKTIQLRVSFFDPEIELIALRRYPISVNTSTYAVLLDNNIMFESLHPFLRTLQNVEPTSIPFSNIIANSGPLTSGNPTFLKYQ
ncbi:hypothetical protein F5148DRAFT_1329332 [Russula earlei]|uniref:Uncharacterized protein n=1 Tax=Russula earlei TaxID=71964 RepID=A0ACC0TY59_9AGAM|nr:hypothetical protein F5148DRAFT_1329332 [Russula earlei]